MPLSVRERNEMIRQGTAAALTCAGAFTCPYLDDEARFEAWLRGYELGEAQLAVSMRKKRIAFTHALVSR